MAGILVIGESVAGRPTRLTLELATLATRLGDEMGTTATVLLCSDVGDTAATEVAAHGPKVLLAPAPAADVPAAAQVASIAAALIERDGPDIVLVGASPDGKDAVSIDMSAW